MREGKLQRLVGRIWSSPSWTSFSSYAAQSAGVAVFLPLLLRKLPSEQVAVVLLFATVGGVRLLIDFGFSYTLMRHISYALAASHRVEEAGRKDGGDPSFSDLACIKSSIRTVYSWLAFLVLLLLATVGTIVVAPVLERSGAPASAWTAWGVVVLTNSVSTWGIQFATWLQGTSNVALLRRWETIFALLSPVSAAFSLVMGGGMLAVTLALGVWQIIAVCRNGLLTSRVNDRLWARTIAASPTQREWRELWAQTWRTGVGVLASFGVVQGSVIWFARILTGDALASFLLGFRVISVAADSSRAPFYSRTPELFKMYAAGDTTGFLQLGQAGMRKSLFLFVAAWTAAAWLGPWLLVQIESKTEFPSLQVWVAFGAAFLLQRWGAMHMQLICAANKILTHISDGMTAVVFLCLLFGLVSNLGDLALPTALAGAYGMVLVPYGIANSASVTKISPRVFESRVGVPVVCCFAVLAIAYLLIGPVRASH